MCRQKRKKPIFHYRLPNEQKTRKVQENWFGRTIHANALRDRRMKSEMNNFVKYNKYELTLNGCNHLWWIIYKEKHYELRRKLHELKNIIKIPAPERYYHHLIYSVVLRKRGYVSCWVLIPGYRAAWFCKLWI